MAVIWLTIWPVCSTCGTGTCGLRLLHNASCGESGHLSGTGWDLWFVYVVTCLGVWSQPQKEREREREREREERERELCNL